MEGNTHVVIMAGGIGSRLWPVSTPSRPKQFMDLLGVGKTMIQLTVERFLPVCDISCFWVVTGASYVDIVRELLPEIPENHILAEPVARNTAPCIAYACWKIATECPDANIVVTPADALVLEKDKFARIIQKALEHTRDNSAIVTVGIEPTRPETGYGYICAERCELGEVVKVSSFKEKPDRQTAAEYLAAGNYFWNAGIFVWNLNTIVSEIRTHSPQIAGVMDRMSASFGTEGEADAVASLFPTCDKVSIDYAVMEHSSSIYVIADDLGWSDLGSFTSIRNNMPETSGQASGNRTVGKDVRLFGCEGCLVHAGNAEMVVVKDLKNYVVAEEGGNILICPLADEQQIKEFSKTIL